MIEPPMVRITERRRPDRGTIERSGAHRDYRMSIMPEASAFLSLEWVSGDAGPVS